MVYLLDNDVFFTALGKIGITALTFAEQPDNFVIYIINRNAVHVSHCSILIILNIPGPSQSQGRSSKPCF